jgi:serine/threonine-protein kinase RsbW
VNANRISIAILADLERIRLSAAALRGVLAELGCQRDHAQLVELCIVEALTNVVKHAYGGAPGGRVELQITCDGETLELVLTDHGRAMPDHAIEQARAGLAGAPAALREGGYGLGLIVELMDAVDYRRSDARNTLTMTTSLRRSAP